MDYWIKFTFIDGTFIKIWSNVMIFFVGGFVLSAPAEF